jgi:predicted HTH transcriptional regulator
VRTADDIKAALALGYETRGVEVKGPGPPDDKPLFAKVARASLSIGNLRDGGIVVIGIDDGDPAAMMPGLEEKDLDAWLDYDTISSRLAVYADPPLTLDIYPLDLETGARVVIVEVYEFAETPHICAKSLEPTLRKGAVYVRTRRMPETAEIATSGEMRELLDLALEKRLRGYVEAAQRAGVSLSLATTTPPPTLDASEARYREQLKAAWDE